MTRDQPARCNLAQFGALAGADPGCARASVPEGATRPVTHPAGRFIRLDRAGDPVGRIGARDGGNQHLGIGVQRIGEQRAGGGDFGDLAHVQHHDPVRDLGHFGILLTVNLAIGANTPPLGIDLMAACRVADIPLSRAFGHLVPFLGVMVAVLVAMILFPALVTGLPHLLF